MLGCAEPKLKAARAVITLTSKFRQLTNDGSNAEIDGTTGEYGKLDAITLIWYSQLGTAHPQ